MKIFFPRERNLAFFISEPFYQLIGGDDCKHLHRSLSHPERRPDVEMVSNQHTEENERRIVKFERSINPIGTQEDEGKQIHRVFNLKP